MLLIFKKITKDKYIFECVRDDGTKTSATLETKSTLRHDLMHYAFEIEAELHQSFYGLLKSGRTIDDLLPKKGKESEYLPTDEVKRTEIIIGMLQGAHKEPIFHPEAVIEKMREYIGYQNYELPSFITPEFLTQVNMHYGTLERQWNNLRIGGVMELYFS